MSAPSLETKPPRVARSLYKRAAIAMAVIVLCTAAAVATPVLLEVKKAATILNQNSIPIPEIDEKGVLDDVDPGGPQTILVLGSDQRYIDIKQKNPTRSDTIILIRLDPSKGATAILSIPRDLKVQIPGHGTDKINAAYADGGPKLSVRTVRTLLRQGSDNGQFPISHVVNINFGGFRRAVDRLKCVFADVDRRYFNDNNPPAGGGGNYSVIDVKAGYQKLCGVDALSYVRYRHFDTDLVRAARQQDFLRQAKDQIGVSKLFSDRDELLKIFASYTQTDIRGTTAIFRLLKLAIESAKNPIQEVHFPADQDGNYLSITPANLRKTVNAFLDAKGSKGARGKAKKSKSDKRLEKSQGKKGASQDVPPGTFVNKKPAEDLGINLGIKVPFPVYYPALSAVGSSYLARDSRAYDIYDRGHAKYRAYRMVVSAPGLGQYYGVQGMTWKAPPLLDNPSEIRKMVGRKYELFYDGSKLRLVAWRTPRAVYWVNNTLLLTLTNKQMLGIARSLRRVGS